MTSSLGNKYMVYPKLTKKDKSKLIVQSNAAQDNFERMTALLGIPFVSRITSVPFDSSELTVPLNIIASVIRPSCVTFVKNCTHESMAVGSGTVILNSEANEDNNSGVSLAITGLITPNIKNTITKMKSL